MDGATDRILSGLRRIRAAEVDPRVLPEALLDVLAATTGSTSASLRRPLGSAEEIRVGRSDVGADVVHLERRFAARGGTSFVAVTRPADAPFDADDELALEILGGEIVLRLDEARAEADAARLRREIDVLRALSRGGEGPTLPVDLADRAASELLAAFTGAHVLVHVMVDDHLELIARRTQHGQGAAEVPEWGRVVTLDGSIAMAVAVRERRMVRRSVDEMEEPRRSFLAARGIRHLLSVPLTYQDVILGSLSVAHREDEPWDGESLRLLDEVVAQLAFELAQARILEAERRRADDLGFINELGRLLAQHLELRAVLSTAGIALARALDVPRVHMLVAEQAQKHLRGVVAGENGVADVDFALTSSHAVHHAFTTRAPVIVEDAENDARTNKAMVSQIGTRSLGIVPLLTHGETIGVIVLVETRRKRRFTDGEIARAVAVSNVVAPAVTNARMFEDLRRSYEALAKAQAELVKHERLAALGELSAVIAHEVRNPVAIIFNSLSELRRLAPASTDARVLLDIVGEETTRLNRIVADLLDFVRPYDVHPRVVDVDAIVRGAVDAARRAAPERCVEIDTRVDGPSSEVVVDGTMLQQALLNLVVNAIQATPNGKRVSVSARVEPDGGRERLRCEVADEGAGIDDAARARIFQPFFTTKATGTGLGLALVRRLVDALGGHVAAKNGPPGGAVFTLTVPLAKRAET